MRKFWKLLFFMGVAAIASSCAPGEIESHRPVAGSLSAEQRFILNKVDGSEFSLEEELSKNKVVLLNFFATWCPPCQEEIPDLIELQNRLSDRGLSVVGIDVEEPAGRVAAFVSRFKINYPVLLDKEGRVAASYGLLGVPSTFLLDSSGNILGEYHAFTRKLVSDVEGALAD